MLFVVFSLKKPWASKAMIFEITYSCRLRDLLAEVAFIVIESSCGSNCDSPLNRMKAPFINITKTIVKAFFMCFIVY
jgi:hypothetical protein